MSCYRHHFLLNKNFTPNPAPPNKRTTKALSIGTHGGAQHGGPIGGPGGPVPGPGIELATEIRTRVLDSTIHFNFNMLEFSAKLKNRISLEIR